MNFFNIFNSWYYVIDSNRLEHMSDLHIRLQNDRPDLYFLSVRTSSPAQAKSFSCCAVFICFLPSNGPIFTDHFK